MSSSMAPLRHRPFRFLVAGRTINALGNSFAPIALAFAVLDLTGSVADLGLVVGSRTVVNVAFLLFGGVLADRVPKRLLMVGASLAAAVTQAVVAVLVLTGTATIPLLMGLAALNGMVGALALPASASILPSTVPEALRQQANAINRVCLNTAAVVGAPVAGLVVAVSSPGWGIAVDAGTFALSALFFLGLRVPEPAKRAERSNLLADLRIGWTEFRSRTWLWVVVAGFCVTNAAWSGGLFVLGPFVADQTFGRQAWGFVLAAQTAGMIVGGLVALRLRLRRMLFFGVACCLPFALPIILLGVYPAVWALMLGAFVAGLSIEQFGVAWETTMQEHVPPDKLARVYSYDMVGSFVAIPIGEMAMGPIAHAAGIKPTLIGAAALMIIAGIGMLSSREVRTLRHELPKRQPEPVTESLA
ncbi:MFS transporter [Paractinoplanes rishiriensis]|uniref:MFS transporter n=1 Tax=Paractinoplanes rishiriensis TaxID=1050105 RepID=A0A919N189_9ACTN|nr:MFS transporter [Actinoplanes rishiriensis]GIE96292.1 MFS transporter [Actinoplanes rishiriensis]